jgi:hypothetical protein
MISLLFFKVKSGLALIGAYGRCLPTSKALRVSCLLQHFANVTFESGGSDKGPQGPSYVLTSKVICGAVSIGKANASQARLSASGGHRCSLYVGKTNPSAMNHHSHR